TANLEQRLGVSPSAPPPAELPADVPTMAGATMTSYSPSPAAPPASEHETFVGAQVSSSDSAAAAPALQPVTKPEMPSLRPQVPPPRSPIPIIAGVIGLLLLFAGSVYFLKHKNGGAIGVPGGLTAFVHTSPGGATIRIDNDVRGTSELRLDLAPGTYQVEAELDGYVPATGSLEIKAGSPNSLDMNLEPAPAVLRVASDTGTGKVWFDDQPAGELEGTQWVLDKVTAGDHKVKFAGPQGSAFFAFTTKLGALPVISQQPAADGVLAVIVANVGGRVHIYCSDPTTKVGLDGQNAVDVNKDGVELNQVSRGVHQLALTRGSEQYKVDIDVGTAPALTTFLESGQNIGTLLVVTHEDKARVFINGQLQKQVTRAGQLQIANLEPREYAVRVSKPGFQDAAEQKVTVRKGEQTTLAFNLKALPRFGSLVIRGGTPGAEVLIDKTSVGTVQPDGTLTVNTINPGDHVLDIQKEHFKTRHLQKRFVAGGNIALSSGDATLEAALGELRVTFS